MKTVLLSLILSAIATSAEAALLAEFQRDWVVPHRNNHVFAAEMFDDVDFERQSSIPQGFTQPSVHEFAAVNHSDMTAQLINNPTWTIGFTLDTTTYYVPVPAVFSLNPSIDKYVLVVDALTPGDVTDSISTRWSIHGQANSVPEPASAALLLIASLWTMRRRIQR